MTKTIPGAEQALSDLQAIAELGLTEPDILELLGRLIDEGTPVLQVDRSLAVDAGDGVVRYKLADELRAILAAVRARNVNLGEVEGVGMHGGAPVLLTREPSA
jgi:hypothetical protein